MRSSDLFPPGFDFVDGGGGGYFSPSPELLPPSLTHSFPQHARRQVCVCLSTSGSGPQAGGEGLGQHPVGGENSVSLVGQVVCMYTCMF